MSFLSFPTFLCTARSCSQSPVWEMLESGIKWVKYTFLRKANIYDPGPHYPYLPKSASSSISFVLSLYLVPLNDLRFPKFMMLLWWSERPPGENSALREDSDAVHLTQDQDFREEKLCVQLPWDDIPTKPSRFWCHPANQEWGSCANCIGSVVYLSKASFLSCKSGMTIILAFRDTEGIKYKMPNILIGTWQAFSGAFQVVQ